MSGRWVRDGIFSALMLLGVSVQAADWSQFRGPNGQGVSGEKAPSTWSPGEGVKWQVDLPGMGSSSPIVVGSKVFVTCFSNPGTDPTRHLVCLNRASGKILWKKDLAPKAPEDPYQGFLREHGYTSSTPASDGERVYVFFGKSGVYAFDLDGKELWHADVGQNSDRRRWGSGSSPILYKDLVIVNAVSESDSLYALDKKTGKTVWKADASAAEGTWGTPTLVNLPNGKQELVMLVPFEMWGLNPDTGKLRWYAEALSEPAMCTTVVVNDGIIYAVGGRQGGAIAIRAGGEGDVTKTHVLWKSPRGSYVTSPVYHDGHLYWVTDRGLAMCLNAKTGEEVYQKRVDGAGNLYASLLLAGDKLYAVTRAKGTFVLPAKPEFEVLSHNDLDDDTDFNSSPAVSNGELFLRSNKRLYCIGK